MHTNLSLKTTLLTAAGALLCTGLQFTGIDSLATQRRIAAETQVLQLPLVMVTAQRQNDVDAPVVQRLPQVVVVGRRLDQAPGTAVARDSAAGTAI